MPKLYTSVAAVALPPSRISGACSAQGMLVRHVMAGQWRNTLPGRLLGARPLQGPGHPPVLTSQIGFVAAALVRLLSGRASPSSLDRLKSGCIPADADGHRGGASAAQPHGNMHVQAARQASLVARQRMRTCHLDAPVLVHEQVGALDCDRNMNNTRILSNTTHC